MKIGKSAKQAIVLIYHLTAVRHRGGGPVRAEKLAAVSGLSTALTSKLLTVLSNAGLLKGVRGPGGGYKMAVNPDELTLMDVISCFPLVGMKESGCGLPMPLDEAFREVENSYCLLLRDRNFGQLVA